MELNYRSRESSIKVRNVELDRQFLLATCDCLSSEPVFVSKRTCRVSVVTSLQLASPLAGQPALPAS